MWLDSVFLKNRGIYSVCSSNENVLDASIEFAKEREDFLLIEATCHQVNQFGGYTNMTPEIFSKKIFKKVEELNFNPQKILLGGDHLGPDPWKNEYAGTAMGKAKQLVAEFVKNGFGKIHLDCSMPLKGDNDFSTTLVADREAELCAVAEETYEKYGGNKPVYVVGTEVPAPGGSVQEVPEVTSVAELDETIEELQSAFSRFGLKNAWDRVIAIVVRLGIGFGDEISEYESEKTKSLCAHLNRYYPSLYFEAHSTDYQTAGSLKQMVKDGIKILKVGPALTDAYRRAIFSLNFIEREFIDEEKQSRLIEKVLKVMNEYPKYWQDYYKGNGNKLRLDQMYSYFDRIRYYWPFEEVEKSTNRLIENLKDIPMSLIRQYLPEQYKNIRKNKLNKDPRALINYEIKKVLNDYQKSVIYKVQ
ncbi:class II D-tagatose-bisphosphate aldolase, non-catalytic subunit [Athalassotoga saccharophila]|uniref:class II D-tagatose-bisphosphate aldolase, non-catalytic subunit n=1 Tax=Athalassotoga saccharophila TaxID=1441386 RepID=UPI001379CF29|nr:class II D-tagatose-bisphosphate aldolase, non-catalytic subunit [Athalassotoga saccharophila]BBJ28188.1 D-tagatose-1,6-bisphosphate aldolase subunit KbaZ [Athalassotoga saccharophila]